MNNTNLTRLKREYDLMKKKPNENFTAYPIQDDLFTWHFTIRGMEDSEFEGGFYHGVIKLPNSYPLKPPNIMFLTPNGRFDVNMDVCLSVTKFHRDEWQASWTIATILEALIAFFPIKESHDAIGAIDYPIEVRKKYAQNSRKWKCDICGPIINTLPEKKPATNPAQPAKPEEDLQVQTPILRKTSQLSESEKSPLKQAINPSSEAANPKPEKRPSFSLNSENQNSQQPQIASNSATNLRPESIKEEEEYSNLATINNESQNNKSEKEDNNSDMSSLVNQKIESQEIKIVKKAKMKKGDFDRKSHLSHNIEGVIFEDINEDEDWEEKEKLQIHSTKNLNECYRHKGSFEDNNDRDSMNIKNEILKKINFSDNYKEDRSKFGSGSNNNNRSIIKNVPDKNEAEKYFENVNFNDINIIKRNNSLDNSAKQAEKMETAKTNIMQELLKHRNLAFITEADKNANNSNNAKAEGGLNIDVNKTDDFSDANRLRHFKSNPIPNSALKGSVNKQTNLKEKYITFENESESETQDNNNNSKKDNYAKGNYSNLNEENLLNTKNKNNLDIENEFSRIENQKGEKDNSNSNIGFIIEKIKKEKQKEILIKDIKEKIAKQSNDEALFYEVAKSIKMHKTADKDEILDEIIQGNLKKFIQKGEILESLISLSGINNKKKSDKGLVNNENALNQLSNKKQIKNNLVTDLNTKNTNEDNSKNSNDKNAKLNHSLKEFDNELKGVVEIMQNLNQNTKSEKLKNFINCKNSALNMLTKTRYTENKEFRIRILNGVAFLLIVIIFLAYHFYLRHL